MQISEIPIPIQRTRDTSTENSDKEHRPRRRVFFLLDSFMLGGTETQAVELARRLDPAHYQVTLGCLRMSGPLLERLSGTSVRIVNIDLGAGVDSSSGVFAILKLARLLRKERMQILHAHDLWSNLAGMAAAMLARVPVIITSQRDLSHDAWYGTYRRRFLRLMQSRSSAVVTNAKAIRDGLIDRDGVPAAKILVVYNGVDLERFRTSVDRTQIIRGSEGKKLIVLVGNMISEVKGHSVLISAAMEVVRRHPEVQFVLVGDGKMRAQFESQVAVSGLTQHFAYLGRRIDIPQILASCDIAVLPSLAEGLPNAVLEYLAAGLPVVASALGGNVEVIQDGVNGLLVPPQNPQALSDALLRLLDDPQLAWHLANSGRNHVANNFSFERMVAEVDNLYTKLLWKAGVSA